jgi:hypothetical protein
MSTTRGDDDLRVLPRDRHDPVEEAEGFGGAQRRALQPDADAGRLPFTLQLGDRARNAVLRERDRRRRAGDAAPDDQNSADQR